MRRIANIACACSLLLGPCLHPAMAAPAQAQDKESDLRGELLYATHCKACHTSEIHWRDKRLATDWDSLKAQVRHWQANAALGWSNDDITAVARYLNDTFYHFPVSRVPVTGKKISGQ